MYKRLNTGPAGLMGKRVQVAKAFEGLVLFRWETPDYLLTDNGKEFDNKYLDGVLEELEEKIKAQMKLAGWPGSTLPPEDMYKSWISDPDYLKMVAGIDLFL